MSRFNLYLSSSISMLMMVLAITFTSFAVKAEEADPEVLFAESINANSESLTESNVKQESFYLKEVEIRISEKLSVEIGENNIALNNLQINRAGGNKTFTFEQVKNVNLNTKFFIQSIDINNESNSFITILKPVQGNFILEARGEYSASQKIPVVSKNISRGSEITINDIELKSYPKNNIQSNDITDINKIIGKTAVRSLGVGKLVSIDDIKNPSVIEKNKTVSALYRTGSIEIKALAIALENGAEGDLIKLKNFDSGKIFRGQVQADGTVLVNPTPNNFSLNESVENNIN